MRLEDLNGQRLGRYEIVELLGRGGMAAVYRAHDTALRRDVALKILYPQYADDAALVERFQREAILAANLDHPNILPIYDVGEIDGLVYIAMRLLHGPTFADLLRIRNSLPPSELIPIIEQIAAALDYAHARQIVHRDIKPANILLESGSNDTGSFTKQQESSRYHAVLTDFGIAKSLDPSASGLTVTGVLIGTPEYMAPEQIHGRDNIDARADIYALGVLAYRALTGRRPFEGSTQEVLIGHLQGQIPAPSSIEPSLSPQIDVVIRKALARDPAQRYSSAGDLARALRTAAGLSPDTPPPAMQRLNDARAVVPRIALDDIASSAEQATRKGNVRPPAPQNGQIEQRVQATPQPTQRSGGGIAWALLGLVLALLIGGGLMYASNLLNNSSNDPVVIVPTNTELPTIAATLAPAATATTLPTLVPSAVPTAMTAITPTLTANPTKVPTTRPSPTQTSAPTEAPTEAPSAIPTETPTITPGLTPSIEIKGGFKLLLDNDEGLRNQLGKPLDTESGGPKTTTEQQYEHGSMFYFQPIDRIYVLFGSDLGTWQAFDQADLNTLPTPPPSNCQAPQQGGFALVWAYYPKVQQRLGCSTTPEADLFEGAYQPFENGSLLYSQKGLGRGKSIYVLWVDGTFQRYDDENP